MLFIFQFAVVQFENLDFSVVPVIWLQGYNHCYWPIDLKSIRTAIIKEMAVNNKFTKKKCTILNLHGKYKL